jgi:thiamine-monophosphate kinase
VPPDAIGHRALAVNLSDLAAMGAAPRLALLSLAVPADLLLGDFDRLIDGFVRMAAEQRVHVAGGNLTRSPGPLMIDVTVAGSVKRRQAMTRAGARPGDEIYVSGAIGAAAAGLQMLRDGRSFGGPPADAVRASGGRTPGAELAAARAAGTASCTDRYLYPQARTRLGMLLGRNGAASAAVDLSDGLADGLERIAEASGVGMVVNAAALPVAPEAAAWFAGRGLDPVVEAIAGGDDYELLFTVRPRAARKLGALGRDGLTLSRIGTCTAERAVLLRRDKSLMPLPAAGYDHFARAARETHTAG